MPSFEDYLADHAGSSFARQLALADYLGNGEWGADLEQGVFTYTPDKTFSLQVLGSESHISNTWLWAWANTQSDLPPALLRDVEAIKKHGEKNGATFLTTRSLELDAMSGHAIAMICSGLAGGKCYYRGPYDDGAAYLLLDGVPASVTAPVAPERAITVINEVISQFEVNHRRAVESFLAQQGYRLDRADDTSSAIAPSGSVLNLRFDDRGLLLEMTGTLQPGVPRSDKKSWQFWKK
jgi:hypothetical protein